MSNNQTHSHRSEAGPQMSIDNHVEQRRATPSQGGSSTRRGSPRLLAAVALLIATVSVGVPNAYTMDFSQNYANAFDGGSEPGPELLMRGEIVPGDYDRLIMYAKQNVLGLATT